MKTLKVPKQVTPHLTLCPITLIETQKTPLTDLLAPFYTQLESGKVKAATKLLLSLLKNDPENPYLLDCLALCLVRRRKIGKSREIIKRNFYLNDATFFVKVRYADMLIRQKKLDDVSDLFGGVFDLALLFPEQKVFQIQDYVLFMEMASWYYFTLNEKDKALIYALRVLKVCPGSSSMAYLMKKMQKKEPWWKRLALR